MKLIPLTKGQFAQVDDENYDYLIQFKWSVHTGKNTFYAKRVFIKSNGTKSCMLMHREILGLSDRNIICDHEDHDGLNNQKTNLRPCSHSENNRNSTSMKGATSKYLGVCFVKSMNRWRASLTFNKKNIYFGHFKTEEEAAIAYNTGALKCFGEFANINKNVK